MSQERADQVLETVVEFGLNHLDTAASYGESELRLAPLLSRRRNEFFLATKTGDRTGEAARASVERSLARLGVDHVDLVQVHNLVEPDEWEIAHGAGGAVEALARARDEGLTRWVGVTGHGLRIAGMHLRSLERFDFDSVLIPYNFTVLRSDSYQADVERLLALCAERRVAVQTIKSVARRRWSDDTADTHDPHDPHDTQPHFSWYQPLTDADALARAVRYVLARPQLFLNTSSDARLLRPILEAASSPSAPVMPTTAEMEEDVARHAMRPLFDGADLERI
jgi:aryl-alcohol dehydrogenase-like predicted oxidoreductase